MDYLKRVWGENAGAHRRNRTSLDHRLREASTAKEFVQRILDDLDENLQDGSDSSSLINWIRLIRNIAASALSAQASTNETQVPTKVLENEVSSPNETLTFEVTSYSEEDIIDMEEFVNDIIHIVRCLYEFSVTIRNPAPRDRLVKCSNIEVSHFETSDIGHISNKFPQAQDFLHKRFGKANTRRRQLLAYYRLHHDKITGSNIKKSIQDANEPIEKQAPMAGSSKNTAGTSVDGLQLEKTAVNPEETVPRPGMIATRQTETMISMFVPNQKTKVFGDFDGASDTSRAQTVFSEASLGSIDTYKLEVPQLPDTAQDQSAFECPRCYEIIVAKSRQSWKYVSIHEFLQQNC